ncbi:MAG: hypothetical protein GEU26_08580 [Nitrososphaeraceae archaeon]|nr:hypothetical protein [Nitrososphaeraceae archaeon]
MAKSERRNNAKVRRFRNGSLNQKMTGASVHSSRSGETQGELTSHHMQEELNILPLVAAIVRRMDKIRGGIYISFAGTLTVY